MTLPNPILGSMTLCVNFHCAPTQKRGFFPLRINFKWGFYKMTPILGVQWHFGSIFTVNALKNHFFWPFFTINTLKIHFWGYFYVKNALSLEKCVILRKKCIFTPKLLEIPIIIEKMTPIPFWVKMTQKWPSDPHFGGVIWPPRRGGLWGSKMGQKWPFLGHFSRFFPKKTPGFPYYFFFKKKPLDFPITFFQKNGQKWPFLVILSLGNPPFSDFLKKNHWIW